jgi:pimeloyl-ACP methyl ester carboxylesterase
MACPPGPLPTTGTARRRTGVGLSPSRHDAEPMGTCVQRLIRTRDRGHLAAAPARWPCHPWRGSTSSCPAAPTPRCHPSCAASAAPTAARAPRSSPATAPRLRRTDRSGQRSGEAHGIRHAREVPRQATGMAGYADYLAGFITEVGLERPYVAGLSFGGALAIELARRHPTIPRTLILVSAYAGWAGSLPAVVGGGCRCSSTTSSRRGFPRAAGHVAPGSAGPSPTTDR